MTARAPHADLPGPLLAAQELLQLLEDVRRTIDPTLPDDVPQLEAARERLRAGLPALAGEPLISGNGLRRNVQRYLDRLSLRADAVGGRATALLSSGALDHTGVPWEELATIAVAGEFGALSAMPLPRATDSRFLATLLDWAVRPVLTCASARVAPLLDEPRRETGRCPSCGALPGLAELRGSKDDHARVLRCLRCQGAWRWPMLACPACEEREHRQLGYLHGEGELEYRRVERCDRCRFYVKALAALSPLAADDLLRADLDSVALDVVAAERGYWRGP